MTRTVMNAFISGILFGKIQLLLEDRSRAVEACQCADEVQYLKSLGRIIFDYSRVNSTFWIHLYHV